MNQFKSIRELAKVRNTARNQDSMKITSRRYHSPDAANKEEWAAHAMKHDMDRALLRNEEKGLLAQVETQSVPEITEEAIIALWQSVPRQHQANAVFYMNVVTHNKLLDKFRNSPYHLMSSDHTYGFQLLNKPIVFYGSSITQGGCVSKAGSAYPTILCRRLDAVQINLGFSGNGKGEENIARHIASLPMSMFVMDYDHNAPTPEHLEKTHEPFFRIIREMQPELPIVSLSRPSFDMNPDENAVRREIIRNTYEHAVAAGDQHVVFVDGELFYGQTDRDMCAVDGTHPNDLGSWRIAEALEPILWKALQ